MTFQSMQVRSAPADRVAGRRGLMLALALGGLIGLPSRPWADMYRWVDETGTTVYSQQPPPGQTAIAIKPDPPPSPAEVQRSSERIRGLIEQDLNKREDQARAAEKAGKTTAEQTARKTNCEAAQKNLATLATRGTGPVRTPDGKYRVLAADDVAKRVAQAREQIKKNCN